MIPNIMKAMVLTGHGADGGYAEYVAVPSDQGTRAGEAKILKRLLSRRFGPLTERITDRIDEASSEQLEIWFDHAVDADSIDGVFGAS